jgi:polysaccharide biosynthesis/export protein
MSLLAGLRDGMARSRAGALLAGVLVAVLAYGCASQPPADRSDFPGGEKGAAAAALSPEQCDANARIVAASADNENYRIQPGDQLDVAFYLNSEFNDEVVVRPDGKITLRLVGSIPAAGLTPDQLAKEVDTAYSTELRDPGASIHVKSMPTREVFVAGRVIKPGAFPLEPGMTAMEAISDAGGYLDDASDNSVVLIRRDVCGTPHGTKLDLDAASVSKDGSEENVALMPRDMLVVPRSKIGNVDLFVQQYIKNLIPIQPLVPIPF